MKKIINIVMAVVVLMCATACSSGTEKSEIITQSEAVIATPTPTPKLPDELVFLKGLDPVKNDDGTYSFNGYFASCYEDHNQPLYSRDRYVTIQAENGRRINSREMGIMAYRIYNPNTKDQGQIFSYLSSNPSSMNGLMFEFVYNEKGNFVKLKEVWLQ